MDRFREAESGFLAARTAWRKCTERGRAQKEEHEAWFKKKQELVDAAFVSDIRVQSQMEELKTFTQEGFGRQTTMVALDDAARKAYKIAVDVKQALQELARYPPKPSTEPVDDGTVFYQAYVQARKQLDEALDELQKTDPSVDKAKAMELILKSGG